MTNSRELAEQAFALLQDALEESEAQRSELEARLHKEQLPEADPQAQLRRLSEQLILAEHERAQWHKAASQLHDVVANERAKSRRLLERIEIAESGTDKNLRKELNYWRQKAEEFSAAKQEFQQRIFALKSELTAAEERFETVGRQTLADDERVRLQGQLGEREQQLSELHAAFEGSKLKCSELETRLADHERAHGQLNEQHEGLVTTLRQAEEARARLQGELDSLRAERDGIAQAKSELERHATQTREERDWARGEVDALKHQVAESRERSDANRGTIEALQGELALLQEQLVESQTTGDESRRALESLRHELNEARGDATAKQQAIESLERELGDARSNGDGNRSELEELERALADARRTVDEKSAELDAVHEQLTESRAGDDQKSAELERLQEQLAELHRDDESRAAELERLRQELAEARGEMERKAEELHSVREQLAETLEDAGSAQVIEGLEHELVEALAARDEQASKLEALQLKLDEREAASAAGQQELESLKNTLDSEREKNAARIDEIAAVRDELADLQAQRTRDEDEIERLNRQLAEAHRSLSAVREQVEELDISLRHEKTRAQDLNEIATSRESQITRLTEKLEETQEHYEETKWQLGKARHFAKLVRRRKKLIGRLIGNIRAKQKATNALKAGLDSLRRYKANADQKQQELLRRIEMLEQSLSESREKLGKAQNTKRAADTAPEAPGETARLRTQLAAQTEVIRSLEQDLKRTRLAEAEMRSKTLEIERLSDDIATKNTFIGSLQKDMEEHQRVQAQLRKREIELREIGERIGERDKKIAELTKENEALRAAGPHGGDQIDRQKADTLEKRIGKMAQQLKQYESTISTLNQDVDRWKRKYEFLAADAPYGLDNAAHK
jgi:chromosome segregation ATPase